MPFVPQGPFCAVGRDAETTLKDLERRLAALISAIEDHPQMDHTDPTNSYPKSLYFVWDFVHRTRHNVMMITAAHMDWNPNIPALRVIADVARAKFIDALGRCHLCRLMVTDRSGEVMRGMTMGGIVVDFGPVARQRADLLEVVTMSNAGGAGAGGQ